MLEGPKGEKRPADLIGAAVMVSRVATGEIQDNTKSRRTKRGQADGKACAKNLTAAQRSKIAQKASVARWQ